MNKKYCLDTSGFSNPLEFMPQDIHPTLWKQVEAIVRSGLLAASKEIYDELEHLPGDIGACIKTHRDLAAGIGAITADTGVTAATAGVTATASPHTCPIATTSVASVR